MNITVVRKILRGSGLMVLAIGIAHFFLPEFGYDTAFISAVPELQRDHFVYLGTYAIGSFLIGFAVLSLLIDLSKPNSLSIAFLGLMTLIWSLRIGLELLFPAKLSLFFLPNAHPMLLCSLSIILIGYAIAFLKSLRLQMRAT